MAHWRDRPEGGNRFWLTLIRWCILRIGRGFARLCLWPITLYFFTVRGPERRASRAWLDQVGAPRRGWLGVLIHINVFATTIVDRVLLLAGRSNELDVRSEGVERLHEILDRGRGCMLVGSHLGSFEVIRVFNRQAPERYQRLKVVMDRGQNSMLTQILEEIDPDIIHTVIDARQPGPAIVLEAADEIGQGGMVTMLADRTWTGTASVEVNFLGQPARLPAAPLAIADTLEVPVMIVFGLYEGRRGYRLIFEPLPDDGPRPANRRERRARLEKRVQHYADRLAHYAQRYPYNWFNFYDFWSSDTAADRHERER